MAETRISDSPYDPSDPRDAAFVDPDEVGLDSIQPEAPSRPDVIVKESDALQVHPENVPQADLPYRSGISITNPAG